jgi:hypothetical protein
MNLLQISCTSMTPGRGGSVHKTNHPFKIHQSITPGWVGGSLHHHDTRKGGIRPQNKSSIQTHQSRPVGGTPSMTPGWVGGSLHHQKRHGRGAWCRRPSRRRPRTSSRRPAASTKATSPQNRCILPPSGGEGGPGAKKPPTHSEKKNHPVTLTPPGNRARAGQSPSIKNI